jgi:hypothetical protein
MLPPKSLAAKLNRVKSGKLYNVVGRPSKKLPVIWSSCRLTMSPKQSGKVPTRSLAGTMKFFNEVNKQMSFGSVPNNRLLAVVDGDACREYHHAYINSSSIEKYSFQYLQRESVVTVPLVLHPAPNQLQASLPGVFHPDFCTQSDPCEAKYNVNNEYR